MTSKIVWFSLITALVSVEAFVNVSHFPVPEYQSEFSEAVVAVIKEFYAKRTKVVFITRASLDSVSYTKQSDLVNEVLYQIREIDVSYVLEGYIHLEAARRRFFNIFLVDSYQSFRFLKFRMTSANFNYRGYFYVIYTGEQRNYYKQITKIFEDMFEMYISNVNVLVCINGKVLVYTYFPFTRFHCNTVVPTLYNRFIDRKFQHNKDVFPKKTYNMHQCPLTVVIWNLPPFMIINDKGNETYELGGIDGKILSLLAKRLNFKLVLKYPPSDILRGTIHANGTASGAFKMVMDRQANLTVNEYAFTLARKKYLTSSYYYRYSGLTMALSPGGEYGPVEKLTFPFKYIIWSCIGSSFLLGYIVIFSLKVIDRRKLTEFVVGPRNKTPFLNMINTCLGGSLTILPKRNFARTFLAFWMLYTMVLRNAYQGALFKFLQTPMTKHPMDSISEMIRLNYTIYGEASVSEVMSPSFALKNYITPMRKPFDYYLTLLHDRDSRIGVICTEQFIIFHNVRNYKTGMLYKLKDKLYFVPIVIYLTKHSYFKEPIDEELQLYTSSGLISYYHRLYLDHKYIGRGEALNEPHIIKVEHLVGTIQICSIFIILSILVFTFELLSIKIREVKTITDFFNQYPN